MAEFVPFHPQESGLCVCVRVPVLTACQRSLVDHANGGRLPRFLYYYLASEETQQDHHSPGKEGDEELDHEATSGLGFRETYAGQGPWLMNGRHGSHWNVMELPEQKTPSISNLQGKLR